MKYVLIVIGLALFLLGFIAAIVGAQDGYDAGVAAIPIVVGMLYSGLGCGIWLYDRYLHE